MHTHVYIYIYYIYIYIWVFPKNKGKTPKSSILIGLSLINHPFWGTPILWKHPYIYIDYIQIALYVCRSVNWLNLHNSRLDTLVLMVLIVQTSSDLCENVKAQYHLDCIKSILFEYHV